MQLHTSFIASSVQIIPGGKAIEAAACKQLLLSNIIPSSAAAVIIQLHPILGGEGRDLFVR